MSLTLRALTLASCAAALLAVSPVAHADTVTPISDTSFLGAQLASANGITPSISTSFTASWSTGVYTDTVTGDLDFVYDLEVTAGPEGVGQITMSNFTGYDPTLFTVTGTGTNTPVSGNTADGVIQWEYSGADIINPGEDTVVLIVKTDATNWTAGDFSAEDGSVASFTGFEPAAATPEPSSFILLGTGLLTAAGFIRRRMMA